MPNANKIVGREEGISWLDQCWNDGVRIASIVAFGGVGKSSLVHEWLQRMGADDWRGAERVYGWSFYRQGMGGGASSDDFFDDALKWFGEATPPTAPWEKGRRLAELVQKERTLLILDGIEPLQEKPQGPDAKIQDTALASFIRSMVATTSGLCVLTTRIKVADLNAKRSNIVHTLELDRLSEEAGTELLRARGADGSKAELHAAVYDYKGHALALTLLGTYVREACDGQIAQRHGLPSFEGEPAQRMMALYEQWFAGKPELSILRLLGLFDRPAPKDEIDELRREPAINGLTGDIVRTKTFDSAWNTAVTRLRDVGLIAPKNADGTLDAHPLVREYCGKRLRGEQSEAFREGHRRLHEFLQNKAKPFPETITEMQPLYAAVRHGCLGGKPQHAFYEVWWKRIRRQKEGFSIHKLGLFGSELRVLSAFFVRPLERLAPGLNASVQSAILNNTAIACHAVGQLRESVQISGQLLPRLVTEKDWGPAAIAGGNLADLLRSSGALREAAEAANDSIEWADRSGIPFQCMVKRTTLACVHHAMGAYDPAAVLFVEAERIQADIEPDNPLLYSLRGFQYCDLLLDRGQYLEVRKRVTKALTLATNQKFILDIANGHRYLGLINLLNLWQGAGGDLRAATSHLNQAVDGLRRAGHQEFLVLGLLARAALHIHTRAFADARTDLDEAMDIATHCGFRLHECDAHLGYARLSIAERDCAVARKHLEKAREIIDATGYHRRDGEVRELDSQLGAP